MVILDKILLIFLILFNGGLKNLSKFLILFIILNKPTQLYMDKMLFRTFKGNKEIQYSRK